MKYSKQKSHKQTQFKIAQNYLLLITGVLENNIQISTFVDCKYSKILIYKYNKNGRKNIENYVDKN